MYCSRDIRRVFCIHTLQKHLPHAKLLPVALVAEASSVPFQLQKTAPARKPVQVPREDCSVFGQRELLPVTNRNHEPWVVLSHQFPLIPSPCCLPPPRPSTAGVQTGKEKITMQLVLKFTVHTPPHLPQRKQIVVLGFFLRLYFF